jgi:hypothetical protein
VDFVRRNGVGRVPVDHGSDLIPASFLLPPIDYDDEHAVLGIILHTPARNELPRLIPEQEGEDSNLTVRAVVRPGRGGLLITKADLIIIQLEIVGFAIHLSKLLGGSRSWVAGSEVVVPAKLLSISGPSGSRPCDEVRKALCGIRRPGET